MASQRLQRRDSRSFTDVSPEAEKNFNERAKLREDAVKIRMRLIKGGANPGQLPSVEAIQSFGIKELREMHGRWTSSYGNILNPPAAPKPAAAPGGTADPLAGATTAAKVTPKNPEAFKSPARGGQRADTLKTPNTAVAGSKTATPAEKAQAVNAAERLAPTAGSAAADLGQKPGAPQAPVTPARTPLEGAMDRIPMGNGMLAGRGDPSNVRQTPTGMQTQMQTSTGPRWVSTMPTLAQVMSAKTGGKWDNWTPDQRRMHLQGQNPDAAPAAPAAPGAPKNPQARNTRPGVAVGADGKWHPIGEATQAQKTANDQNEKRGMAIQNNQQVEQVASRMETDPLSQAITAEVNTAMGTNATPQSMRQTQSVPVPAAGQVAYQSPGFNTAEEAQAAITAKAQAQQTAASPPVPGIPPPAAAQQPAGNPSAVITADTVPSSRPQTPTAVITPPDQSGGLPTPTVPRQPSAVVTVPQGQQPTAVVTPPPTPTAEITPLDSLANNSGATPAGNTAVKTAGPTVIGALPDPEPLSGAIEPTKEPTKKKKGLNQG